LSKIHTLLFLLFPLFLFPGTRELYLPPGENPLLHSILLTNTGSETARFYLKVNGNLSVNLADLVSQIRATPEIFPGEPDYRKAWRYISKKRYHSTPLTGSTWQHNPCFLLNSVGFGLCDDSASMLGTIWSHMGYETRVWGLEGHVVSEVKIDGRWQMFDGDEEVYYFTKDRLIAGVEELVADPSLVSNAIDPFSPCSWGYGKGCARIYGTPQDNKVNTEYYLQKGYTQDLQFVIPARGSLSLGGLFSDKTLLTATQPGEVNLARRYAHAKLVIPAHWTGTVDLPLALHDIRGDSGEKIFIEGKAFTPGSEALDTQINLRTKSFPGVNETFPKPISISNNARPLEILYLINQQMIGLKEKNTIELSGDGEAQVKASVTPVIQPYRSIAWSFEEEKGDSVLDSQSHAKHGVLRGCGRNPGVFGKGLSFDGISNRVDLTSVNMDFFYYNSRSFTLSMWFQLTEDPVRMTLFSDYAFGLSLIGTGNNVSVSTWQYTNTWASTSKSWALPSPLGTWHHLAYTYTEKDGVCTTAMYIDGVSNAGFRSLPVSEYYAHVGPYLGVYSERYFFRGMMDEVKIIGRVLSAAEIKRLKDSNEFENGDEYYAPGKQNQK